MRDKILIVDDTELNRVMLRNIFQDDYYIIEVQSGEEAIEVVKAKSKELAVVLLDLVMEGISGFDLLEMRNEMPEFQDIPVVVITGSSQNEDQTKAFELGASEYLIKPINPVIASSRVRNVIFLHDQMVKAKSEAASLKEITEKDEMTGILNKVTIEKQIDKVLKKSDDRLDVMLVIDIDKFKSINDTYGHQSGDLVIKDTAKMLIENFRKTDIVGRIGGDEFCVLMIGVPSMEVARKKVTNLLHSVKYSLNHMYQAFATISVGMASNEYKQITYEELFMKADEALYQAKENGRAQYREYGVDASLYESEKEVEYKTPESVLEAMIHYYMDDKNVEATLHCVMDDVQWVGTEEKDRAKNKKELRKMLEASVKAFPYSFGVQIEDLNKQMLSEDVVQFVFNANDDNENEDVKMVIRMNICCENSEQGWKVKSFHASVPSTVVKTYALQKEVDQNRKMEQTLLARITGGVAIYRLKKDGRITTDYVTDGVASMFGYDNPKEFMEFYQDDISVSLVEEDRHLLEEAVEKSKKRNIGASFICRAYMKNGSTVLQRIDADLIDENLGKDDVAVWYAVHTKVSDETKREMKEQERYRLVLEILHVAYWEWSSENGYYISPRYYEYAISDADQNTLWTEDEYKKYVHPDDVQIMMDFINKDKSVENTAKAIARCKLKDGTFQWTELYSFNEYDEDGNLSMIISAMRAVDEAWIDQKGQLEEAMKAVRKSGDTC